MRALAEPAPSDPVPSEQARAARTRWNDLGKRTLSAALLAPIALACIWLGREPWTVMMAVAAIGLAAEWVALCGLRALSHPGAVVPGLVLLGGIAAVLDQAGLGLLVLLAGTALVWRANGFQLAAGVPYVGLGAIALVWLRGGGSAGRDNVLFLVLVVWASDIGAYLAGRLFGGPKLAPAISPGKTRSGALGGLAAAILVGMAAASWLSPGGEGRAALAAAALGIASQGGDLLESWIKRRFGVKDSGALIPGHGGLLDRLDGLLTAAPAAAILSMMTGRGGVLWH